jgi:hypothetical protein
MRAAPWCESSDFDNSMVAPGGVLSTYVRRPTHAVVDSFGEAETPARTMPTLAAEYTIEIAASIPIRVPGSIFRPDDDSDSGYQRLESDELRARGDRDRVAAPRPLRLEHGGFGIDVAFLVPQHIYNHEDDERKVVTTLSAIKIRISRHVGEYAGLDSHRAEFEAVLRTVMANFIAYNRYVKSNVLLRGLADLRTQDVRNPKWTLDGVRLDPGKVFLEGSLPGRNYISEDDYDSLQSYLTDPPETPLYEVLLAEARDARALRDIRRTVIDLAIVCEVLLKTKLFGRDQVASSVVEKLEEHNVLRVSLKELLAAAGRAFGSSLSDTDSKAYSGILALYDTRSRIVHHGRAEKKSDGRRVPVEASDVADWFAAVDVLRRWLDAGCAALADPVTPATDV